MIRTKITMDHPMVPEKWKKHYFKTISLFEFEEGEMICTEDEKVETVFCQCSGMVKPYKTSSDGRNLSIRYPVTYQMLGEIELFLGLPALCSVVAVSKVVCIGVDLDEFRTVLSSDTEMLQELLMVMAQNNYEITRMAYVNILGSLETKLCYYLDRVRKDDKVLENLVELSEMMGLSYRHVQRAVHELCEKGVLERSGRCYHILNLEALQSIAENI